MYEDMTYEYLLSSALGRVSDTVDKRQGSIIYDAVAPVCAELARVYADLDLVIDNCFADTASREYLVRRAAERGIEPYAATYGIFKGEFNMAVEIGARFNLDEYNYCVTEYIEDYVYKLQCETAGSAPNYVLGSMTPIEYISGLTYCELTEVITPGEDEESTEDFRTRYFQLLQQAAFGGNVYDYKEKVKEIDGVGQVRVYRCEDWLGAGTVGVAVTDSENQVPDQTLIDTVQSVLDPNSGDGTGIAPIGHIVTVVGAEAEEINVSVSVSLAEGLSESSYISKIQSCVASYIAKKNQSWEDEDIYIYTSQISAAILDIEGVVDVSDISVNDSKTYIYLQDKIGAAGSTEVTVSYA